MKLLFKTAIRYYTLTIQPDLLGEYDIICQWADFTIIEEAVKFTTFALKLKLTGCFRKLNNEENPMVTINWFEIYSEYVRIDSMNINRRFT